MIELAIVLIVIAMALFSVALTSRSMSYPERGMLSFVAALLSAAGGVVAFLSR